MKPAKTNNGRVRLALIGVGGEAFVRHIRIIQSNPDFELVGVVDCREEAIERVKKHFSGRTAVADRLGGIDWLSGVDAVVISTSLKSHYPLVREALEAGLHVLCEKPFVETVAQGEELVELAAAKGRSLAIMHNWLFAGAVNKMRRDLKAGCYGRLHALSLHLLNNPRRPVPAWHHELLQGQIYDESPHCLYLLREFAPGKLVFKNRTIVRGLAEKGNTPGMLSADFVAVNETGAEIPVHTYFNFDSPVCEWRLVLLGEKAMGTVDMFRNIYTLTGNDGSHGALSLVLSAGGFFLQHWMQHVALGWNYVTGRWHLGHDRVFARFADHLLRGTPLTGISGADALEVLRLQHAMLGAHQQ